MIKGGWVSGVAIDTRSDCSGRLYAAIEGENKDGHDFLEEALQGGAGALLVSRRKEEKYKGIGNVPVFKVEDTVDAIQKLAAGYRDIIDPVCVGVTGTAGKTETKEMAALMLSSRYKVHATPGNYNNHIGLPLTILGMEEGTGLLVAEMGANHKKEIELLSGIAKPDVGIITNIGPGHLEFFKTIKGVAAAKAELLQSLSRDSTAVLPADDEFFEFLRERSKCRVVTFGFSEGADWRPEKIGEEGGERNVFSMGGGKMEVNAAGRYHLLNAAAAAAASHSLGVTVEEISEALKRFRAVEKRGRKYEMDGIIFVNDSYNSNPLSLRSSVEAFMDMPVSGNRWLVLGDMLELGGLSAELHEEAGKFCGRAGVYGLITMGDNTVELNRAASVQSKAPEKISHFIDMETLSAYINGQLTEGDAVLLKGSRKMGMWNLIDRIEELRGTKRKRVD